MIRFVVSSLKVAVIVITTLAVALGGFQLFDHYSSQAEGQSGVGEPVVFTIGKNDDADEVARNLHKKGSDPVRAGLRADRPLCRPGYQTGDRMSSPRACPSSTIVDLITTEKSKAVTKVKDYKITVVEGWRAEQIADELDKLRYPPGGDAFLRATRGIPARLVRLPEGHQEGHARGIPLPGDLRVHERDHRRKNWSR